MGTRSNIHFNGWGETQANVYRHWDGYPEAVLPDLRRFFETIESQTSDTRYNDPTYLAAKFVVFQAGSEGRLDFTGVGVVLNDAGDGEYVYTVDCDNHDENGRPTVTYERA